MTLSPRQLLPGDREGQQQGVEKGLLTADVCEQVL